MGAAVALDGCAYHATIIMCCLRPEQIPAMLKQRRTALDALVSTCSVAQSLKAEIKSESGNDRDRPKPY